MYSRHAIVAGILGTVATVGWTVQGLGNAYYFRQARMLYCCVLSAHPDSLIVLQIWQHHTAAGHSMEKVSKAMLLL